jgi:hypothetical protein
MRSRGPEGNAPSWARSDVVREHRTPRRCLRQCQGIPQPASDDIKLGREFSSTPEERSVLK